MKDSLIRCFNTYDMIIETIVQIYLLYEFIMKMIYFLILFTRMYKFEINLILENLINIFYQLIRIHLLINTS